jgi:adenylate cyclase
LSEQIGRSSDLFAIPIRRRRVLLMGIAETSDRWSDVSTLTILQERRHSRGTDMNPVLAKLTGSAAAALAACFSLPSAIAQVPAAARPVIAVLPLANSSADAAQDFFAEGLTDEIAVALAGVKGLDVVARSSAFRFKQPGTDPKAAGQALHADYLVQGSTSRMDGRVALRVGLVRASDGASFGELAQQGELRNIFDLEETAARTIAGVLKLPVDEPLVRNRTADLDGYLDFLRAKAAARPRGAPALAAAAKLLEPVVMRDPDFAPASALLAYVYSLTPLFAPSLRGGMPAVEHEIVARTVPKADALARRATARDPKSAEAFVALAYANMVQRKMLAAEDAFKQALALNPNQADGLHGYSQLLAALGRIKESLAMREHLQAGEQFIINYTADTAEIVWLAGDTDKAIAMLMPFAPGRTLELALVEASAGRYREAAAAIRQMPPTNYPPGMTAAAATILDSAPAQAGSPAELPRLGNLSFAFMHVGAPDRVLEFYEDEVRADYFQPISTTWFWHPTYAAVRATPRFRTLARDLGLVDYWRARGWPPQCRPMGSDDFVCE